MSERRQNGSSTVVYSSTEQRLMGQKVMRNASRLQQDLCIPVPMWCALKGGNFGSVALVISAEKLAIVPRKLL